MEVVGRVLAAAVGAVVAWAGANKVTGMDEWHASAKAQSLPSPVAFLVPPAELVLGVGLVVLSPVPLLLGLVTLLLTVFTAFLAVQVARGSDVPCACFGSRRAAPPSRRHVARNVLMIAALFVSAAVS